MYCVAAREAPAAEVTEPGAEGVQIQWLLGSPEGVPNFALRRFVIAPGGHTPMHTHPWEHEIYVVGGDGAVVTEAGETPLRPDCAALVPPDEAHCFRAGAQGMQMLCLVPLGPATAGH